MTAVSILIFPLLVAAMTAFAVFGSTLDLAGALGLAPAANPGLLSLAAVVGFYATVALLERVHPYRAEWNRPAGDRRTDLLHLLFTGPLSSAAFEATGRGVAAGAAAWLAARFGGTLWPAALPAVAQLYLAIAVAELGHYWFHRVSHERPLVWRLTRLTTARRASTGSTRRASIRSTSSP